MDSLWQVRSVGKQQNTLTDDHLAGWRAVLSKRCKNSDHTLPRLLVVCADKDRTRRSLKSHPVLTYHGS